MAYQIAEGVRLGGRTVASEQDGVFCFGTRQPLGVVGIITPWNFPFNVVCRKAIPALMAGNTVVFKPASFTPITGVHYTQLFDDVGLPPGVFNLVTGQGAAIGDTLVEHPLIRAISFTGSTAIGRAIERKAIAHGAKAQMEMGGKNPAIVLDDADLDQATAAILLAAYACAGQWCTSTSRVIAVREIADALTKRLVEGANRIGRRQRPRPQDHDGPRGWTKPVADGAGLHRDRKERGSGVAGRWTASHGRWVRARHICRSNHLRERKNHRCGSPRRRSSGPCLSILIARDFDEAIDVANGVPYGLSSSLFTRDMRRALTFIERTEVGLTHVNMPTGYKEAALEFGGVKESGAGLPESGEAALEFFTDHRVAYLKYR